MRREMPVERFDSNVIVEAGAEMDMFWWQHVQAEDTQHSQARDCTQPESQHHGQYIGRRSARSLGSSDVLVRDSDLEGAVMRINVLSLVVLASSAFMHAATWTIDFSADTVGQPPKGFVFGHTAKTGSPGTWVVQAEGTNKYLIQTNSDATRSRFPLAVAGDVYAADVDVSVRFRPVSGRVDRAAGLVWRYRNEDNYYLVRANALEDNVVLYKVERSQRTDLPVKGAGRTYGQSVKVPAGQWSTLRVVATGPLFAVWLNGKKLYDVEDATFSLPGRVGVWTKADSVTQFDDLTIVTG